MEGRDGASPSQPRSWRAATDVNFGALARAMVAGMTKQDGCDLHLEHEVRGLRRDEDEWCLDIFDPRAVSAPSAPSSYSSARADIRFRSSRRAGSRRRSAMVRSPVSGQWLRCTNRDVIGRHFAKVWARRRSAPPMSVPHLDSRWIDGQAGAAPSALTRVSRDEVPEGGLRARPAPLRRGSATSAPSSAPASRTPRPHRVPRRAGDALHRRAHLALRRYYPAAEPDDWEVQAAGLRVQIIKADGHGLGELKFGTEVVTSADGIDRCAPRCLPGASTAARTALEVLERCFTTRWRTRSGGSASRSFLPTRFVA